MAVKPPRVWVSSVKPARGEVVRVRAQIEHLMESGLRVDPAGNPRPRNIVRSFEARLGPQLIFRWEPGIGIAQNPYIEFTFLARESGELLMLWTDEANATQEARKTITLS
ncbi:thiosulfate oxidation carrier complex protein SoxZ [Zoogloea sp.]|uniref:thiosulfate oxidation carrier complex protein SoxZ n=1 Tax=Zoogloea sp. TaxID=49181 RepID=UPI0026131BCD|nr:thiosulfate oxidation carrier complex protein SoxZ [Zoogloea sp.]MDD3353065.1 thiosulfate oxidation carrier complex protein SoxZ [Zoogloea sp.]